MPAGAYELLLPVCQARQLCGHMVRCMVFIPPGTINSCGWANQMNVTVHTADHAIIKLYLGGKTTLRSLLLVGQILADVEDSSLAIYIR